MLLIAYCSLTIIILKNNLYAFPYHLALPISHALYLNILTSPLVTVVLGLEHARYVKIVDHGFESLWGRCQLFASQEQCYGALLKGKPPVGFMVGPKSPILK